MKKPLIQWARSLIQDLAISASNYVNENTHRDLLSGRETTRLDWIGWWLEDQLVAVFGWAYAGSDEELLSVYHGEIPPYAMSERQRALLTPREDFAALAAHCCHCRWEGDWEECCGELQHGEIFPDSCPECGEHIWLSAFDDEVSVLLEDRH